MLVGRGVLRNPWILAQAADLAAGRPPRVVTLEDRGQFLLDYIELLMNERVDEVARAYDARLAGWSTSFARSAPGTPRASKTAPSPHRHQRRAVVDAPAAADYPNSSASVMPRSVSNCMAAVAVSFYDNHSTSRVERRNAL